jgi:hypothetical protein
VNRRRAARVFPDAAPRALRDGGAMNATPFAAALLIAAALAPAPALAAGPQGTYRGTMSGDEDNVASVTVDQGKVIGLTFTWRCGDEEKTRLTGIVTNAAGEGGAVLPVKKGRFSVARVAPTSQGEVGRPDFHQWRGKTEATGRWSGKTVTGTFSTTAGGCKTGKLTFSATLS